MTTEQTVVSFTVVVVKLGRIHSTNVPSTTYILTIDVMQSVNKDC